MSTGKKFTETLRKLCQGSFSFNELIDEEGLLKREEYKRELVEALAEFETAMVHAHKPVELARRRLSTTYETSPLLEPALKAQRAAEALTVYTESLKQHTTEVLTRRINRITDDFYVAVNRQLQDDIRPFHQLHARLTDSRNNHLLVDVGYSGPPLSRIGDKPPTFCPPADLVKSLNHSIRVLIEKNKDNIILDKTPRLPLARYNITEPSPLLYDLHKYLSINEWKRLFPDLEFMRDILELYYTNDELIESGVRAGLNHPYMLDMFNSAWYDLHVAEAAVRQRYQKLEEEARSKREKGTGPKSEPAFREPTADEEKAFLTTTTTTS